VHENIRIGIKNLFSNAMAPVKLLSSLLQLDFEKSGRIILRTLINTTFGIGGLADVAGEEYHIDDVNEDLGQALGSFGIPTGPYVVLPFFGPSTARNIVGRAVGSFMSPTFYFAPSTGISAGLTAEENINDVSFIIDDKKQLEESALDEYESMRDFYHQYRHGLVKR
jgi:phospholipid-binding lipoprotein MlaA